ncbi:MAG: hypothetical protein H2056_02830 [Sphingopyxis sp.]|nr:hypothetical protein [Sphingopyxis sp.]
MAAAALGHWLGGGAALGRADAALLIPTLIVAALFAELMPARYLPASIMVAIALPTMLLLALCGTMMSWLAPQSALQAILPQLAFLAAASLLVLALVRAAKALTLRLHIGVRLLIFVTLTATWWLASHVVLGHAYTPTPPSRPAKTLMLTSLPLQSWAAGAAAIAGPQDGTALAVLRQRIAPSLVLTDGLATGSLCPNDRLLLAHPSALSPETLVEVDRFVRAGGRAVILADGLSSWPPPHRLGDPRNPPVTSLLTPLLDHWRIRLDAPVPGGANSDKVTIAHLGHRLTLHSPGNFARLPRNCRGAGQLPDGSPTIATCRIGLGTAVLLADADMMFDPLWRPEPLWASHLRTSDNIEWLASQLNEPYRRSFWGLRPTWREAGSAAR